MQHCARQGGAKKPEPYLQVGRHQVGEVGSKQTAPGTQRELKGAVGCGGGQLESLKSQSTFVCTATPLWKTYYTAWIVADGKLKFENSSG